ncbi:MAG TPA: serine protease [Flavobacterium sp.]|nr:serine protease [Flavobacterium sp.]
MDTRHSILRPLTTDEQEAFAVHMCNFFSPSRYRENCALINMEVDGTRIRPLSFGRFLSYLQIKMGIEPYRYLRHLDVMIQKFVNNGFFVRAGYSSQGSPPMNHCYYAIFELTNMQKSNLFWLGSILGEEYLMAKFTPFIVRFEGSYANGHSGTGSGILINKNTILTCRHNLTDLKDYSCYIGDTILENYEHKYHDKHDLGIVKLSAEVDLQVFPYFGQPYVLDNTLTMGYPPLRGMREAALISQKGEINAISKDWGNCDCITISSTVRPGNSGGPVISHKGYIVGIVTQYANSADSVSTEKEDFKDTHAIPFYNAIASTGVVEVLKELDASLHIAFENYQ